MAIARLSMKVGRGGQACPHAAYIAREGRYAHHLSRGEKLEAVESGNMPAWAQHEPLLFWQAADAHERSNGTTYREMEIALPRELDAEQRIALVREFVAQEIGERHAYQWAIHTPVAIDGQEQPHLHFMFSERQADGIERDPEQYFKRYNARSPEKGGARKGYGPHAGQTLTRAERAADLKELRGRWEITANTHLEQLGQNARIDMRSHAERGTGLVPEVKQLPSQWRGEGRENVIEFRQARAELLQAHEHVQRIVPDAKVEVISLEAERQRRAARQQGAEGLEKPQQAIQVEQQPDTDEAVARNSRAQTAGQEHAQSDQTRQAAAAGIARFRAQFEQAKRIEAGKKQALESFQRFKAEQQAQQRQVELRQAEQTRLQVRQRKQARSQETTEKLKQRQAREARKRGRDGPDWSR